CTAPADDARAAYPATQHWGKGSSRSTFFKSEARLSLVIARPVSCRTIPSPVLARSGSTGVISAAFYGTPCLYSPNYLTSTSLGNGLSPTRCTVCFTTRRAETVAQSQGEMMKPLHDPVAYSFAKDYAQGFSKLISENCSVHDSIL